MSEIKKTQLQDVIDFISGFESGEFSKTLPSSDDPVLSPLIESLNKASKSLAYQAEIISQSKEDRTRMNALFTQSADAIMTLAPPTWTFTSCNPAALKLFKVSSTEEFLRLGPWNLAAQVQEDGIPAEQKGNEAIQKAMKTGRYFFEGEYQTTTGEIVNCTVLLSRVDVAGQASYLQATVRDITQDKLREREFKSIFWDSPLGIIRFDSDGRYLTVNPAYEKFLGYSASELVSKSILDLTHPDDRFKTLEKVKSFFEGDRKAIKRFEKRFIHKSGHTIWGRVTGQVISDTQGRLTFLSIIEDITEQKAHQIETATILETMAEGLVIQNEQGVIESFNPAALNLLGLSEDQLRGRTSMDTEWKAVKQDGTPYPGDEHPAMQALKTGRPVKGAIMGLVLPDLTERWIKINAIPFEGALGRQVACTFSDVTELFNTQAETRFVLDSLKIGVWKFNPVDQSLQWHKSMYQLFDVNESDFSGHYEAWESTLTPESKQIAVEELGKALRGEKQFNTIFEIDTKSNGKRFISGRAKVTRDLNGQPIMMYGINMDVTEEIKIKKDLEFERTKSLKNAKLASLGEMSAGIAHEINNPLAIISGTVGLLSKFSHTPEKFAAKVETIKKSCDRISRIVGGLRKFSRSGDKSNLKNYELSKIIQDTVILTEAKSKRHSTPVILDSRSSSFVYCDEVEIEQVFVNLINNAIDAVKEQSERWVKVSLYDEGASVVIRVMDSGSGIPENVRDKLFEPFFTTKKVGEGTGLGLSITKGILDEHKATIHVVSECSNTCFEIRFSRAEEIKDAA